MKYFSLFTGIGGFELGIQQAYNDISTSEGKQQGGISQDSTDGEQSRLASQQPICIGYSEIDKYAIQIYERHFNHKNYGDITKIAADTLPDFDLLCGGFPCQAFSVAGKRRGFDDTRGTLFFDICRLAKAKRPRLLLLENVKGLLNHDGGQTFRTILASLDELGYDCQWQVCNSKNHGVPQNRERVIIIAHRRGTRRPNVFPLIYGNEELTINEKVYSLSKSVSSYSRELLLDTTQQKGKTLSREQMQDLFSRIRVGIQEKECEEIERESPEIRQQSEGDIQEVDSLQSFMEGYTDTETIYGVVRIPTEEMLLLWSNGGDVVASFRPLQQQDAPNDSRQNRLEKTLSTWEHSPLLLAVQPYQGRLFYSIGDGRDWVKIYQTKVEVVCKENSLSCILEEHPDQKYFLSEKQVEKILSRPKNYENKLATRSGQIMGGATSNETYVAEVQRQPLRYLNRNQKNYEGDYAFTVDSSQTAGVRITNPKMLNFKGSTTESPAITATSFKEPPVVNQIRRLTPTECERLQGFPDGWTVGVSDTQRYKTLGNAVTVNVIKAVSSKLIAPTHL